MRGTLLLAVLLALALPGCSSSRSNLPVVDGATDGLVGFPDAPSDLFVPPEGSSLRSELVSGAGLSQAAGIELQGVVGELMAPELLGESGATCQWDSIVLPIPQ
jgi:hypothetical protein